ncbi:MerR family transcriptional regulator [Paenibacillus pinistramenti]|uniref:MerR family transcriptional regulator n=1 Tax=Paenibacillus pinistramenti TaxID=1768003 RepID=UPI00110934BE|nr:MerR family transcriptional regulator [Paenibacillus pinistramenti]
MTTNTYSIQQISEMTGLSAHTLRYYEKIGLLTEISRDLSGYRQYSDKDLSWIQFLIRLQETGMKISGRVRFAELRSQGESTISSRRELLESHRDEVHAQISKLLQNLKAIEDKIEIYKTMELDRNP